MKLAKVNASGEPAFCSPDHSSHVRAAVEASLVAHPEKFLLELAHGLAFVGRQHHFIVGTKSSLQR